MCGILRSRRSLKKQPELNIPGPRHLNLLGFFSCAGMMGFALYAQHILLLSPCPLCIFQRLAVISLGILFMLSAIQNPGVIGRMIYAGLLAVAALAGIAVAGRHAWLQMMPEDQVPACGPGLTYILDSFPFGEALALIFAGSGECADVVWSLFGLSMPAWVLICLVVIGSAGAWNNLRAADTTSSS